MRIKLGDFLILARQVPSFMITSRYTIAEIGLGKREIKRYNRSELKDEVLSREVVEILPYEDTILVDLGTT